MKAVRGGLSASHNSLCSPASRDALAPKPLDAVHLQDGITRNFGGRPYQNGRPFRIHRQQPNARLLDFAHATRAHEPRSLVLRQPDERLCCERSVRTCLCNRLIYSLKLEFNGNNSGVKRCPTTQALQRAVWMLENKSALNQRLQISLDTRNGRVYPFAQSHNGRRLPSSDVRYEPKQCYAEWRANRPPLPVRNPLRHPGSCKLDANDVAGPPWGTEFHLDQETLFRYPLDSRNRHPLLKAESGIGLVRCHPRQHYRAHGSAVPEARGLPGFPDGTGKNRRGFSRGLRDSDLQLFVALPPCARLLGLGHTDSGTQSWRCRPSVTRFAAGSGRPLFDLGSRGQIGQGRIPPAAFRRARTAPGRPPSPVRSPAVRIPGWAGRQIPLPSGRLPVRA